MRNMQKFLKLFYHKAYVWQFLEANGELEMFFEAQERVREILGGYEHYLTRSCEAESQTNASKVLVGNRTRRETGAGAPAGGGAGAGEAAMVEG